jgi:hypothetical protein
LDYLSLWLQERRKAAAEARVMGGKTGRGVSESDEMTAIKQISRVEGILQRIPAEVISRRAVECGSFARALFHWEQYYRQQQEVKGQAKQWFSAKDDMLEHLQMIYAQIDEPDCMEGISAHLRVLNPEQQIIEDRKAGRWTAAQSWYEIALAEKPNDTETQINLLTCLKESGQYGRSSDLRQGAVTDKCFRLDTQLRRRVSCFQHIFQWHSAICGGSSVVGGQMGPPGENPWLLACIGQQLVSGLQRRRWTRVARAASQR